MRFWVSSPREGQLGKHVVTCSGVPQPSIASCESAADAQSLADELTIAYERWERRCARLAGKAPQ